MAPGQMADDCMYNTWMYPEWSAEFHSGGDPVLYQRHLREFQADARAINSAGSTMLNVGNRPRRQRNERRRRSPDRSHRGRSRSRDRAPRSDRKQKRKKRKKKKKQRSSSKKREARLLYTDLLESRQLVELLKKLNKQIKEAN